MRHICSKWSKQKNARLNYRIMRKTVIFIAFAFICLSAGAQSRQQNRRNADMYDFPTIPTRQEIVIPDIDGYKVIKADLHVHTSFSDACMTPANRVQEAWQDGLDAIAITDHIEHRTNDKAMAEYLRVEVPKAEEGKVGVDLNVPVKYAVKKGRSMGILVIPGLEITRNHQKVGHFCALFTKDNNLIPDSDPLQAIRNAKQQGAVIQANHPGWRRTDNEFTPVAKAAIKEGLISGVEVFNEGEFYPDAIDRAVKNHFYVAGNTDIHITSHDRYGKYGDFRNMTLILAKDASPESIKEALESGRTIAHSHGDLAGPENILRSLFNASVEIKYLYKDSKKRNNIKITNKSSFPYSLEISGVDYDLPLEGLSSIICTTKEDNVKIKVKNMWSGADKHPSFEFSVQK